MWTPSYDFEDEIVDLQPDRDLMFANYEERETSYPRPKEHLLYAAAKKQQTLTKNEHNLVEKNPEQPTREEKLNFVDQQKFNVCRLNENTRTKQLGQLPTSNSWNTEESLEEETIALMRNMGMESFADQPLDEQRTLATHPIPEGVVFMRKGNKQMPIFFGKEFFELKPKPKKNSELQVVNGPSLADSSFNQNESRIPDNSGHTYYEKNPDSQSIGNFRTKQEKERAEEPENSNKWSRKKNTRSTSSRWLQQQQFFTPKEKYVKKAKDLNK